LKGGHSLLLLLIVLLGFVPPAPADTPAAEAGARSARRDRPEDADPSKKKEPVIYVPKSRGRANTRSGGGTRGAQSLPRISAIAPEHEGLTTRAKPTLYWHISAATDVRIDFTLSDEESADPLIEITLNGPVELGIHALRLSDFGLNLDPETRYLWFVSMIPDPLRRSDDVVAGAALRRVVISPQLRLALDQGVPPYQAYAENGIWYDCISALDTTLEASPGDSQLVAQRAAFFEQVGLSGPAEYARE